MLTWDKYKRRLASVRPGKSLAKCPPFHSMPGLAPSFRASPESEEALP
jgi:hypothetical protein